MSTGRSIDLFIYRMAIEVLVIDSINDPNLSLVLDVDFRSTTGRSLAVAFEKLVTCNNNGTENV